MNNGRKISSVAALLVAAFIHIMDYLHPPFFWGMRDILLTSTLQAYWTIINQPIC